MKKIPLALVGLGKIARDQHVPTLAASDAFELVAIASPNSTLDGVRCYKSLEAMLEAEPDVAAVSLCTTPQVRYQAARYALEHGRHVLLEKPPGATISEVQALIELASQKGLTLFASWHSRHAAAVETAREWLAPRKLLRGSVAWKEDVRFWHPGQHWIWKAGGLGVFDPGINALSILTRIVPGRLALTQAELVYPSNCETPIAARMSLVEPHGACVEAEFDFRQTGPQTWDIALETSAGRLLLSLGGSVMRVDDNAVPLRESSEYAGLYAHFATLVRERRSDVDLSPLQLVADAFLCGRPVEAEPFIE